jgi:hypothetical protein
MILFDGTPGCICSRFQGKLLVSRILEFGGILGHLQVELDEGLRQMAHFTAQGMGMFYSMLQVQKSHKLTCPSPVLMTHSQKGIL